MSGRTKSRVGSAAQPVGKRVSGGSLFAPRAFAAEGRRGAGLEPREAAAQLVVGPEEEELPESVPIMY